MYPNSHSLSQRLLFLRFKLSTVRLLSEKGKKKTKREKKWSLRN